jgi:hypothetical protein
MRDTEIAKIKHHPTYFHLTRPHRRSLTQLPFYTTTQ